MSGADVALLLRRSERDDHLPRRVPTKDIYFAECSGSQSSDPANTFSDTLKWHARNLIIGSPRNWGKTVINWNIALDPWGGLHVDGCGTCTGLLTIGPGDKVTPDAESLDAWPSEPLSQAGARSGSPARRSAPPVGPGKSWMWPFATRTEPVCSSRTTRTTTRRHSAFSRAIAASPRRPGDSVAVFTWTGNPGGEDGLTELDPSGWRTTADPPGPADPWCHGDVAASAVDEDASTQYSTGTGKQLQRDRQL
jgi:glucosylceramidase